jgi:hypothetical protein
VLILDINNEVVESNETNNNITTQLVVSSSDNGDVDAPARRRGRRRRGRRGPTYTATATAPATKVGVPKPKTIEDTESPQIAKLELPSESVVAGERFKFKITVSDDIGIDRIEIWYKGDRLKLLECNGMSRCSYIVTLLSDEGMAEEGIEIRVYDTTGKIYKLKKKIAIKTPIAVEEKPKTCSELGGSCCTDGKGLIRGAIDCPNSCYAVCKFEETPTAFAILGKNLPILVGSIILLIIGLSILIWHLSKENTALGGTENKQIISPPSSIDTSSAVIEKKGDNKKLENTLGIGEMVLRITN